MAKAERYCLQVLNCAAQDIAATHAMIHNEHLRRADESYEIRHDNNGNAVHAIEKDGCFIIYPTLHDLVMHQYLGQQTERFYIDEERIDELYSSPHYMYYELKKYWER